MANKYKISTRWVYQIWRGAHLPIDPKDIKPLSEEPGSYQQADSVECNVISGSKNQLTSTSPEGSEGLNISREDLNVFYEKEAKKDEKNKAEVNRRLAV
ncbi:unnamed protein product [Rhizophagus irregularis]|nr:unnamed protein product [Rhizophagus irregularis]